MKNYTFDIEITSIEEHLLIEEWCRTNATNGWKTMQLGFNVAVELVRAEDAVAFRLKFGV